MSIHRNQLEKLIRRDLNLTEMAKELGYANGTCVRRVIIREGLLKLWLKHREKDTNKRKRYDKALAVRLLNNEKQRNDWVKEIKRLILEGKSHKEIRKILKISKATLNRLIRNNLKIIWDEHKKNVFDCIGQGLKNTVGEEFLDSLSYKERVLLKDHWDMWKNKKAQCRGNGTPFDIPFVLLQFPTHCPITREQLIYGKHRLSNRKATLDRIDPTKGYVLNNVRVISHKANRMKGNATVQELQDLIAYIKESYRLQPRFYYHPMLVRWRKLKKHEDACGNVAMYGEIVYTNQYGKNQHKGKCNGTRNF